MKSRLKAHPAIHRKGLDTLRMIRYNLSSLVNYI